MVDDSDSAEFYRAEMRHSRRQRRCEECTRWIYPGEIYETATMKHDGRIFRHMTCQHCIAVRGWLTAVCGGFLHGGVDEDLADHVGAGLNPRWLAHAVSGMQRRWRLKDGSLQRPMSLPKHMPTP